MCLGLPDLVRGISASSFLQRSDGGGSPCTWHLNSTLSSTSATWFTGLRTKVGRSDTHTKIHTLNYPKIQKMTYVYNLLYITKRIAYQTQRAEPSRSPSRPPCWLPHTRTSPHRSSGCWRWSASHLESEQMPIDQVVSYLIIKSVIY